MVIARIGAVGVSALLFALPCSAQFQVFNGGTAAQSTWRSSASSGLIPLENFDSFHGVSSPFSGPSDRVMQLPGLGIELYGAAPGTYPGVYSDGNFAHSGLNQLANFGGGGGAYSDYFMTPRCGLGIHALGFGQCDPQGSQVMEAYDAGGGLVGSITGHINDGTGQSFAGFVSSVAVMRVRVVGAEGDGWNHLDDLQIAMVGTTCCGSADFNCDGDVGTESDIEGFFACLAGNCPALPCTSSADFNGDGDVGTDADIEAFFRVLAGGSC